MTTEAPEFIDFWARTACTRYAASISIECLHL